MTACPGMKTLLKATFFSPLAQKIWFRYWTTRTSPLTKNDKLGYVYEDSILYASPATKGVQGSFDLGKTFLDFNEGLPPETSSRRLKMDDQYMYVATGTGIYKRLKSDIVKRAISGQVYLDGNNNQPAGVYLVRILEVGGKTRLEKLIKI